MINLTRAGGETVDAPVSGAGAIKCMWVQIPSCPSFKVSFKILNPRKNLFFFKYMHFMFSFYLAGFKALFFYFPMPVFIGANALD